MDIYAGQFNEVTPMDYGKPDPNGGEVVEFEDIEVNDEAEKQRKLINAIQGAEQTSYGGGQDSGLSAERARSIDDYLGKPYGNEVEGRSKVVSRDVYDTVEWIKPSLLRIFTSGEDVALFDPEGPEDELPAKQESEYINYVVQQKNPWFNICYEWFTDALLTKNAYALAYWDTTKTVESERYVGLTDDQFALLTQQEIEVVEHSSYPDEVAAQEQQAAMQQQAQMAQQQGMPFDPQPLPPPMLHDVVIRRTKESRGVKICVLPPERCKVSENVAGMSVRHADFFGYWEEKSISDIRKMGFDVPDDISDDLPDADTEEDQARDQFSESNYGANSYDNDPSMRKVALRMSWIKFDYDGDGIAEHRCVFHVGDTVLYNEECSGVPVAGIVPTPLPHRHPGLSVRDVVTDLQEIKTALWRGGLDNLYLSNNGRYGVSDKVNLSDMLNSRPGGMVRVKDGLPGNEIFPFTHPVTIAPALQMMEYTDSVRQGRTGTSQQFTGVDPNVLSKSHSGVAINQLTSSAAQRVETIARIFAEGVKELLLVVHELILKHSHKAEVMKVKNQWVTVDPSQWKKRSDMSLSVGLGTGNKEQLMSNLLLILQAQKEAMQIGATNPQKIYHALTELTKAAGFASADRFWSEPPENPPQPGPKPEEIIVQGEIQKETIKQQEETKRKQMEIESKERIEAAKIQADIQIAAMKQSDSPSAVVQLSSDDQMGKLSEKITTGQSESVQVISNAMQSLYGVSQMLADAVSQMNVPKRKIPKRDKNGRIEYVDEIAIN
jgi:hypothetical protein